METRAKRTASNTRGCGVLSCSHDSRDSRVPKKVRSARGKAVTTVGASTVEVTTGGVEGTGDNLTPHPELVILSTGVTGAPPLRRVSVGVSPGSSVNPVPKVDVGDKDNPEAVVAPSTLPPGSVPDAATVDLRGVEESEDSDVVEVRVLRAR